MAQCVHHLTNKTMRFLQPCRLLILGIWLLVLMVLGFTIQLMGTHCQKSPPQILIALRPLPSPSEQTCRPKSHIVFLKTHKTAGSTVLNMLHRYGDRNSLTFALPQKYQFYYPNLFKHQYVKGYYMKPTYDILCHHMRFNLPEVRKLMPADSFYFTILRDPATLAESSFSYYRSVSSAFKKAPNFTEFIAHPSHYYKPGEKGNQHARNFQWFDLGLNPDTPFNESVAKAGVGGIERTFHLVLLSEYFDESMVLLKEELCWDLDDVVTFKLNTREASTPLEKREVERLRAWNALDWYLYVHFNRTFWEKVERFGRERMDTEVRRLRERRQELAEICLEGSNPVRADQIREEGIRPYQFGKLKILGWVVKRDLEPDTRARCVQMVTPELRYKDILDEKQFPGADIAGSDLSQQGSQ
ncbi:galactose-3-O-sulfotransferase 4 isoform X2 [Xenopus tropicalis]|uniref:Galactose-3-O-sulfotransferase 4 isoform X2 n=1 Tax=Xenopus tropicalis TaxID=8364 RepID=A0A8J1JFE6_XENTR|nr:galactose-3-O-sulfotransferase 4 isoform X2 [Xenopus tropicalis]